MVFEAISAATSIIIGLASNWISKKAEADIKQYYKITIKLFPIAAEIVFNTPLTPINLNKKLIAKSTSVVGIYYLKKRKSIISSIILLLITSAVVHAVNDNYQIQNINLLYGVMFVFTIILVSYFALLTYRVKTGDFGSTDADVRELLSFIYKNADVINDNNKGGGGKKLKIFDDAPEKREVRERTSDEVGVRV